MSDLTKYSYTILRYVHDISTGEFVNVGVVLHAPQPCYLRSRMRTTYGRLTRLFPGADGEAIKRSLLHIEQGLCKMQERAQGLFPPECADALQFARSVLVQDDSSLQWSALGSGVTSSLDDELDYLFEKYVLRYDKVFAKERRNDQEIWKEFSRALQRRQVLSKLTETKIVSDVDQRVFEHAWKNGVWHCLEPLSFDLVDGESIHAKALKWVGQVTALASAEKSFKLYLLIGEPKNPDVLAHYDQAMRILKKTPMPVEIYTESRADELSELVAAQVNRSEARGIR